MWAIIIALVSGAIMSVQGVFNTGVTKQTSVWLTAAWVALSGFVVAILMWAFFERGQVDITSIGRIEHKYMLLGGVFGAFITWSVVKAMGELGPAKAVLLIIISQLLFAYLIELFGMFHVERVQFEWRKLIGFLVSVVGFIIFQWEK